MATVAFVTEEGAAHQAPYREALDDIDAVDRALLMDPGGATFDESLRACGAKVQAAETSVEALLRHGAPDMAIVSMIGANAPAVIEPLLDAGVHVMAEKPACAHPDQFERTAGDRARRARRAAHHRRRLPLGGRGPNRGGRSVSRRAAGGIRSES